MSPGHPAGLLDSPLRSIMLVEKLIRPNLGSFRSVSPPGHLLHLVLSGTVEQFADDRLQLLRPGHMVWYHHMETIGGKVLQAPWQFISINFIAPTLSPPCDAQRVRVAAPAEIRRIRALARIWHASRPSTARSFQCFALMNHLLAGLALPGQAGGEDAFPGLPADRWWTIEKKLRLDLGNVPPLPELARQTGLSLRSLTRICLTATGLPPARRIAALRLTQARHLLQFTDLSATEIALRLGYPRVQELSRAMRKQSNLTPRDIRKKSRAL